MRSSFLLLPLVAVALIAGLISIVHIRYASGDVYPAYSTLRADPEGAMALYESFERSGVQTARKYQPLSQAPENNATVFYLGLATTDLLGYDKTAVRDLETAAKSGTRLVLAIDPGRRARIPEMRHRPVIESEWKIHLARAPDDDPDWPLWFDRADGWTITYRSEGRPVILEKAFGAGSIVLLAESFPFSNRAMVESRSAELLVSLAGTSPRIVFDESHFGIAETGSVLALARRYRLLGLLGGLALLALAFIWKNAMPFPPPDASPASAVVAGLDVRSGFVRLLRRNIAPEVLIETCLGEWRKSRLKSQPGAESPAAAPGDPVAAYREIQQQLGHS